MGNPILITRFKNFDLEVSRYSEIGVSVRLLCKGWLYPSDISSVKDELDEIRLICDKLYEPEHEEMIKLFTGE